MTFTLWLLHLLIEIAQACALQDLPAIARYAMLATCATTVILLAITISAPPKMLEYCDDAHDQVAALLHEVVEAGARRAVDSDHDDTSDARGDVLTRVNSRLTGLEEERLRLQRTVWGLANSAPLRVALSMPLYFCTWRLLYNYYVLSQDVKALIYVRVTRAENVTDCIENTPVPTVIRDSSDRVAREVYEMDSYVERDLSERA